MRNLSLAPNLTSSKTTMPIGARNFLSVAQPEGSGGRPELPGSGGIGRSGGGVTGD